MPTRGKDQVSVLAVLPDVNHAGKKREQNTERDGELDERATTKTYTAVHKRRFET